MAAAVLDRPHVLHSAKEYHAAMNALDQLLERNPKKGTREFEILELLSLLVEDYETRNIPEPPVTTPQAMVEFMLEQKGLTRADLADTLGGKSRVSEFFTGKRPLSTNQIRALRDFLGVPADLLLEPAAEQPGGRPKTTLVSLPFSPDRTTAKTVAAKGTKVARKK